MNNDQMRGALRGHRRRRELRAVAPFIFAVCAGVWSWFFEYDHQTNLLLSLVWVIFVLTNSLELRLKTMQVRLATIADQLDKLAGQPTPELGDNLLAELSDW